MIAVHGLGVEWVWVGGWDGGGEQPQPRCRGGQRGGAWTAIAVHEVTAPQPVDLSSLFPPLPSLLPPPPPPSSPPSSPLFPTPSPFSPLSHPMGGPWGHSPSTCGPRSRSTGWGLSGFGLGVGVGAGDSCGRGAAAARRRRMDRHRGPQGHSPPTRGLRSWVTGWGLSRFGWGVGVGAMVAAAGVLRRGGGGAWTAIAVHGVTTPQPVDHDRVYGLFFGGGGRL